MMLMSGKGATSLMILCGLTLGSLSFAKGLDDLKPESEDKAETSPTPEGNAPAVAAEVKPEPMLPSETSKELSGKLYLATGFGFSTLAGDGGEWAAGGLADIVIGYMTGVQIGNFLLAATYRYQAVDFTVDKDNRAYRGVLEGHHFGSTWHWRHEALTYVGQSELGLMVPAVEPLDGFETDKDLEKAGVNITVGGGVDYQVMEKIQVGGRLMVGAGSFNVVQLATSASFMF